MIFAIDSSSFLKVIDEQNTLCIQKYRGQNLVCWCLRLWSLWIAFTCCCPLSWLPIWLQSDVVNPWFIHYHIITQNFFLLRWNSSKQHSESSLRNCFWSAVSKNGTHFEHNFLIDKCSCKMLNTLPSDIFNFSAISCNFNLQSVKSILRSCFFFLFFFLCFPGQLPNFGDLSAQHHLCLYDCV